MLKMPFTLSRKKPEPTEPMSLESKKVVLREKRIEDALDDYTWRVDDELAKLDATRPLIYGVQRLSALLAGRD